MTQCMEPNGLSQVKGLGFRVLGFRGRTYWSNRESNGKEHRQMATGFIREL